MIGLAEQRSELVHETAGNTGGAHLGIEHELRGLSSIELEPRLVGKGRV